MSFEITLEHVRRAWDTRDPSLVDLVDQLSRQEDPEPETPIRDGALTIDRFLRQINSQRFREKPAEEQQHFRVETMKALEANDAEVPLPDRLKLHEIIIDLWNDNGHFARTCLLKIIARVNLTYGPWRALKRIFKEAEEKGDTEIYGALAARFDMALARRDASVSQLTLGYLCRRAWRFLRHTGQSLPVCYADFATDVLANYRDGTGWSDTWIGRNKGTQLFLRKELRPLIRAPRTSLANFCLFGVTRYPSLAIRSAKGL